MALVWAPTGLAAPGAPTDVDCASWPGEPDPLPTIRDPDPDRARWASVRLDGLVEEAIAAESRSLAEADRFWRHVLCLDPEQPQAKQALRFAGPASEFATPEPVVVTQSEFQTEADLAGEAPPESVRPVRPEPVAAPPVSAPPIRGPDPVETLPTLPEGAGVTGAVEAATPEEGPRPPDRPQASEASGAPNLEVVNQELREVETLVRQAHFRTALSVASSTRDLIDSLDPHPALEARRAQLDVLAATCLVALGRDGEARARLASALRADPNLELDASTTSPKVLRLLDDLQSAPRATPWDEDASVALDIRNGSLETP